MIDIHRWQIPTKARPKRASRDLPLPLVGAILLATAGVGVGPRSCAAQENTSPAFELRPGVLVDPQRRVAYVMSPKGGIDAIGLPRGERIWSTRQGAKPLAMSGDLLVAQAEKPGQPNELEVVTLDTRQGGTRVATAVVGLPNGTRVSIDDTVTSIFVLGAQSAQQSPLLWWEYSEFPPQGIVPGTTEEARATAQGEPETATRATPRVMNGAIRLDLSAKKMTLLPQAEISAAQPRRVPDARVEERLPAVAGTQFVSADGRHVLASERVADDSVWDKYKWTIYDRAGKRLGEVRSHLSRAPFFVLDSELVHETGPYVRRTERGMIDEPLKIRAVDLRSGKELWNRPVRDTAYRGPFPP